MAFASFFLLVLSMSFAMQSGAHSRPPRLLQIVREPLKPGSERAYDALEQEQARICAALGCPNPYLGAEALTGSKEVWWFNAYQSEADRRRVYDAYANNTPLMKSLQRNSDVKTHLTFAPLEVFARYRPNVSGGLPWTIGQGRFLVIAVTTRERRVEGTVFETALGTRFIVRAAHTRTEGEELLRQIGGDATILAVRPDWSFPDESWIAADPLFWKKTPASRSGR